jgi:tRNA 2-selenouridine synthase
MTGLSLPTVPAQEAVESGCLIIDVRSPAEYSRGSVPGSINLPLLGDAERAEVGTMYAEQGARAARMCAVELVSPSLPEYLSRIAAILPRGVRPAVMCWRGGERSRNVVLLLALVGVQALQVEGGYRAYRRTVMEALAEWRPPCPVFTLYGYTGSGKSALLRAISAAGAAGMIPKLAPGSAAKSGPALAHSCVPWVLDLEGLALHRGSLLGGLNQPGTRNQRDFEALLWKELRRPAGDCLLLEGEGPKIGDLVLPRPVARAVREGIPILVESSLEDRTRRIMLEYAPERWTEAERVHFRRGLDLIGARLPAGLLRSLRTAFDDGRFDEVVKGLLVHYYDPLYQRSSVHGRAFVFTLDVGLAPEEDADRLVSLIGEFFERTALKRRV